MCRRRAANSFTNRHELKKTFWTRKFPRFHARLNEILDINQRLPVTSSGFSLNIKARYIYRIHALALHDFRDIFHFFLFGQQYYCETCIFAISKIKNELH